MAHLRHDRDGLVFVVAATIRQVAATVLRQSFIWVVNCQIEFQQRRRVVLVQSAGSVRRIANDTTQRDELLGGLNVRQSKRQLLSVNPHATGLSTNPVSVLIDSLERDGLANVRSVTGIDSQVAVDAAGHVSVRNDSATINKLLADACAVFSSKQSVSRLLKLEPLIANRSDSAAIGYGLDGFNLSRPSNATTYGVNRKASVRACPQTLV